MVENTTGNKPYKSIHLDKFTEIRTFKDPTRLFWHRDLEDRMVKLLEGEVEIQFDNELPHKLEVLEKIFIKKLTYHRVISKKPFTILLEKYD